MKKTNYTESEKLLKQLKGRISDKRFKHTVGVRDAAVKLAKRFNADEKKAEIAAILHDCAKNENQLKKCAELGLELDKETLECPPVIHAPLGAEIAKRDFGIEDEEILNAIRRHTVGDETMTKLDKIIYLADMIEPNRDYKGVDELRKLAKKDLDAAFLRAVDQSIIFNINKGKIIHTATVKCRNGILQGGK